MDCPTCPKCGFQSGNDWRQCRGRCPMPRSPHADPTAVFVGSLLGPHLDRQKHANLVHLLMNGRVAACMVHTGEAELERVGALIASTLEPADA